MAVGAGILKSDGRNYADSGDFAIWLLLQFVILPTLKTGAAIRKQVSTLVENLLHAERGKEIKVKYDGYTSCPLVTGNDSLF